MSTDAPEARSDERPESHGVHAACRGDARGHEEPHAPSTPDPEAWTDATETGGDATK